MKKAIILMLLVGMLPLFASTVEHRVMTNQPDIFPVDQYQRIQVNEGIYLTKPGMPQLPSIPVSLLLAPGEKAVSVTVETGEPVEIELDGAIYPCQTPVPLSRSNTAVFTQPNQEVYTDSQLYPSELQEGLTTQYYRGHSIALVNVYPVQYSPADQTLLFYPDMTVRIETSSDQEAINAYNRLYRGDDQTNSYLRSMVNNEETISYYPPDNRDRTQDHLLVIITDEDFVSNFDPLMELKTKQGFNPMIVTVDEIYSETAGEDNQDKIRNFIEICYEEYNSSYFLLGGDVNIVPFRGFYIQAGDTTDNGIPSDLYYSSLDRVGVGEGPDWNTNDNNRWGENDEADYIPEVAVGRISAQTSAEFDAAINKQVMYQLHPVVSELDNALMVGEQLNDNPATYGGNYKDQIIVGGSYDGYMTAGISENFNVDTLYERDTYWSRNDLAGYMNSGINLLNHLGHSNTDYNMKFYNDNVTNSQLTANGVNHNFFQIYSQGCYSASFDYNDSIAEKFTTISNGCAVYVGNSRYGWYMPGGTNSSSQYLDRQFYDALFGEGIYRVSDANNDTKVEGANQCANDPWFRWAHYEVNVFGDPTLELWTAEAQEMSVVYPAGIPISATQFEVQTGIPGAMVGVTQNGEHIDMQIANNSGNVTIYFSQPLQNEGTIDVTVSAHNYLIDQAQIPIVASDAPFIVIGNYSVDAGGDEVIEFGEEVSVSLTLMNMGQQPASGATMSISYMGQYITITDNSETFGDFAAGESVTIDDAFIFTVSENVPDNFEFNISGLVSSGSDNWTVQMYFTAYAPELAFTGVEIDDGGDGILQPGEVANLNLYISNSGGASANNLSLEILTVNPIISFESNTGALSSLGSDSEDYITLQATVSEEATDGYLGLFSVVISGDNGLDLNDDFIVMVGQILEGFENGDFSGYEWDLSGNTNWSITNSNTYDGQYSARSGNINSNQSTTLEVTMNVLMDGEITFYKKVSCENDTDNNFDYMFFAIDDEEQGRWDGEVDWSRSAYPVSAGIHTFTWTYLKDGFVDSGSDCGWIDNISFPANAPEEVPGFLLDTTQLNFGVIDVGETVTRQFNIFNLGVAQLNGTIDVPEGFSIGEPGRNEIEYSVVSMGMATFQITFAPQEEAVYSANALLTSNDPFNTLSLLALVASTSGMDAGDEVVNFVDKVYGNSPNPFNPETTIRLSVQKANTPVTIDIYNIRGQKVKTLLNDRLDAGMHNIVWRGDDAYGKNVSSGIYFYKTRIGSKESTRKMLMMK